MKPKIEYSDATITKRGTAKITQAEILAAFKLPGNATVELVAANGTLPLGFDDVLVVTFEQRTTRKPRKKKVGE